MHRPASRFSCGIGAVLVGKAEAEIPMPSGNAGHCQGVEGGMTTMRLCLWRVIWTVGFVCLLPFYLGDVNEWSVTFREGWRG
jgi:hypothetical protein